MSDLFKNVFWYIIQEMSHKKIPSGWFAFFIPNRFKTQKVVCSPSMLGYIPDQYKTHEMCNKAVEKDPSSLELVLTILKLKKYAIRQLRKTHNDLACP